MPNEFQNRDQMLNSIAQNAAINTPMNPPVNSVPQTYNPVTADTTPGSTNYAPVEEKPVGLKPNLVNEPAVSTFRSSTESTQSPVISGVPASEYETMTPPPVSGVNYKMTRADSSWQAPTENLQVPDPNVDATPKKETPAQPTSDSSMIVDDDIDMDFIGG